MCIIPPRPYRFYVILVNFLESLSSNKLFPVPMFLTIACVCSFLASHFSHKSKLTHSRHLNRFPIIGFIPQPSHCTPIWGVLTSILGIWSSFYFNDSLKFCISFSSFLILSSITFFSSVCVDFSFSVFVCVIACLTSSLIGSIGANISCC